MSGLFGKEYLTFLLYGRQDQRMVKVFWYRQPAPSCHFNHVHLFVVKIQTSVLANCQNS